MSTTQTPPSDPTPQGGMTQAEDWTKKVTINPPAFVKFQVDEPQTQDAAGKKAIAKIQIINKSKSAILFKVRKRTRQN